MPAILDLKETQEELQWLDKKLAIKANRLQGQQLPSVRRGEVYWCEFGYNLGSEIRDVHPCVIVQNNSNSRNIRTVIVAPITHASSRAQSSTLLIPITKQQDSTGKTVLEGYVDVANVKAISKGRLKSMFARLPNKDMESIDKAIAVAFDLYGYYSDQSSKLEAARKRGDEKEDKIKLLRQALTDIKSKISGDDMQDIVNIINEALKL